MDKVEGMVKPFTEEKRRQIAESLLRLPVDPPGLMPFEGLLSYIQRVNMKRHEDGTQPIDNQP